MQCAIDGVNELKEIWKKYDDGGIDMKVSQQCFHLGLSKKVDFGGAMVQKSMEAIQNLNVAQS